MHGVDETHVHRFGRHDQRLCPFSGPEKPYAVQDRAVGHAAGREDDFVAGGQVIGVIDARDRKSTRLNSSHLGISYAVFCLKKKKTTYKKRISRRCSARRLIFSTGRKEARTLRPRW